MLHATIKHFRGSTGTSWLGPLPWLFVTLLVAQEGDDSLTRGSCAYGKPIYTNLNPSLCMTLHWVLLYRDFLPRPHVLTH